MPLKIKIVRLTIIYLSDSLNVWLLKYTLLSFLPLNKLHHLIFKHFTVYILIWLQLIQLRLYFQWHSICLLFAYNYKYNFECHKQFHH